MKGFRWCAHCGSPHGLEIVTCPETGESLDAPGVGEPGTKSHGLLIDGKYRIGRRLGTGPSGVVYEAHQIQHGWTVAIKLVRPADPHDAESKLARARESARALTAAAHPNICVLQDLGTAANGTMYFVTERLRGAPLKIAPSAIPEEEARAIMIQILSALHAAHEAGIVHDNLKPTNIYLARRSGCPPLVKVLDFGSTSARSPRYGAPELLTGRTPDRRGDLWSCGVILYRMLTGQRPYERRDVRELLEEIDERAPIRPSALRQGISTGWDAVIRRALEKDKKRRFHDALEFIDALPLPNAPEEEQDFLPSLNSAPPSSQAIDVMPDSGGPSYLRHPVVPMAPRLPGDPLGRVVANKYRLDALLGRGNAGAVYRGVHVDLGRTVAVKILHPQNRTEAQFVGRFKKEARMASQLDHVNVTRVLDFGEEIDGLLYLVMEYVAGKSLEAVLSGSGKLATGRVVNVGIQVCNALVAAHELGIVHRDIKPENILLVTRDPDETGPSDLVKVCDFGTAKLKLASDPDLTGVGMLFGSPAYMSPEQARCEELDSRSDLYSLGVTLYEALLGELPILGADLGEQLVRAQHEVPRAPSDLLADIDPLLEDILLRLLEKEPSKRHANARELRAELQEVASQAAVPSSMSIVQVSLSKYPSS